MYKYEEALQQSNKYFGGDELAAKTFLDKYALRDEENNLLENTPDTMFRRIAKELSRIEKGKFAKPYTEDEIFGWMDHFHKIIPQGGCLFGIGNYNQYTTLSNCYVVDPPQDSYGGIHHTDEQITQISKRRGGCGTDVSYLRPQRSVTRNSSRTSTGPITFMERFSHSIREVGQDGRRGALMLTMHIRHPNSPDFSVCKRDKTQITGANISLRIDDLFMRTVKDKTGKYELKWPIDSKTPKIVREIEAIELWHTIMHNAWDGAEPGVLFWDTIIRESVADCYAKFGFITVSTNPCSELPLSILDSCRLLLLNLYSFVVNPFTPNAYFDYLDFYNYAQKAQRLLDDIVDLELEAIDRVINKIKNIDKEPKHIKARELELWTKIRETCANGRRTGTGITALGDMFAALGIRYGSDESIEVSDKVFRTFKFGCYRSSVDMAKELGPFPVWDHELEKDNPFLNRIKDEDIYLDEQIGVPVCYSGYDLWEDMQLYGRRNIALLTISPAGTVSIEAQTSSGVEPAIFLEYERKKKGNMHDDNFRVDFTDKNGDTWMKFKVEHPKLTTWKKVTGNSDISKSPWYGCCAEDIDYRNRIKLQSTIQKHIDHSISATINLPEDVTVEEVGNIYMLAWESGLKGITVYRKGSRDAVMTDIKDDEKNERGKELKCDVYHITVKGQQYFVLVGLKDEKPYEVFAGKNGQIAKKVKKGTITRKNSKMYKASFDDGNELSSITDHCTELEEIVTRLTSLSLRSGASIHRIVQQLEKVGEKQSDIHSFSKSVARALKGYIPDGTQDDEACPECQTKTIRQQGCIACPNCQWSKCS